MIGFNYVENVISNMTKTTSRWKNFWEHRKIDWNEAYLKTWEHPHREMICEVLNTFPWVSLLEIGCGPGANLKRIVTQFKNKQVGGIDINKEAIELAQKTFTGAFLKVNSAEDIMMSDNSADVTLTDMCLIYFGPQKIGRVLKEIKRITRNYVVFCELDSTSWWERLKLFLTSGLRAYDYKKLLEKYGFQDIIKHKIPKEAWPGGEKQHKYGYIIVAKIPRRKNY